MISSQHKLIKIIDTNMAAAMGSYGNVITYER